MSRSRHRATRVPCHKDYCIDSASEEDCIRNKFQNTSRRGHLYGGKTETMQMPRSFELHGYIRASADVYLQITDWPFAKLLYTCQLNEILMLSYTVGLIDIISVCSMTISLPIFFSHQKLECSQMRVMMTTATTLTKTRIIGLTFLDLFWWWKMQTIFQRSSLALTQFYTLGAILVNRLALYWVGLERA